MNHLHLLRQTIVAAAICTLPLHAEEPAQRWIRDELPGGVVSLGEYERADIISITNERLELLCRAGDKLVLYWASTTPKTIAEARRQIDLNPTTFFSAREGFYVRYAAIDWIQLSRDEQGQEKIVLKGATVELAVLTDPIAIRAMKTRAKL